MLHHESSPKGRLQKKTIALERETVQYWDLRREDKDVEWIPLEHPYKEGYFLTLTIDEGKIKSLSEELEKDLRELAPHFVNEFVSMEKRPQWKKTWDLIEDLIITYEKRYGEKTKQRKVGHMFKWISAYKDKNEGIRPRLYSGEDYEFFKKRLLPYMILESWEYVDWKGETGINYAYVLDPKWRKYFQFRRYERWITHKLVKDGTLESRKHWLDNKLYQRDMMWYKYDERASSDTSWSWEGKQAKEKFLRKEALKDMRALGD